MRGFFLVLEGIDGVGKTTQAALLAQRLRNRGYEVLEIREPGGTPAGEAIRELLRRYDLVPWAETCLFLASRAELVQRSIRPAMEQGKIVLGDRFGLSTLAYQGAGRGLPREQLEKLNSWVTGGLEPDLVLVIDLEVEEALARTGDDLDPDLRQNLTLVRQCYLELARQRPERIRVVEGRGSVAEVNERLWRLLKEVEAKWRGG
ncbi:dTMP kinase [Desulfothermobacter acidiphilus]|uniref:dTMP kinase n=1 Tax=Desulfothermobacter acidiphilus TaxID=1938353 RepID=UPI003F891AD6